MNETFKSQITTTLDEIRDAGLYKQERSISSAQSSHISSGGKKVLNFCANNYLGLANHPKIIFSAKKAMDTWGFGLASVRFICGTQDLHLELEAKLSNFLGMEDSILMRTVEFLKLSFLPRMRSFLIHSIMHRSLTEFVCVNRSDIDLRIAIWQISSIN